MISSGTKRTVGRILNSLIMGLNTCDRLPCMVVILIDKDLIEDVNIFDDRAEDVIAENLGWLFKQFNILIKRRKIELSDKKPGSVYGNDPKFVLVEMLRRLIMEFLESSTMRAVLGLRKKFNAILNDAAAYFGYHHMYLESCSADYQYDRMGKMNDQGLLDMLLLREKALWFKVLIKGFIV